MHSSLKCTGLVSSHQGAARCFAQQHSLNMLKLVLDMAESETPNKL